MILFRFLYLPEITTLSSCECYLFSREIFYVLIDKNLGFPIATHYDSGKTINYAAGGHRTLNLQICNSSHKEMTDFKCICRYSIVARYSRLSLSRLRLSPIIAYLEEKILSLFKHRNLISGNKILWIKGEIAPGEQFLPFSTIFSIYISN